MSWHCPDWPTNEYQPENGEDIGTYFAYARCTTFTRTIAVNENDTVDDYDQAENAYCSEHSRTVYWDEDPQIAEDIDNNHPSAYACSECSTVWLNESRYEEHRAEEHEDENCTIRPTTHSLWAAR